MAVLEAPTKRSIAAEGERAARGDGRAGGDEPVLAASDIAKTYHSGMWPHRRSLRVLRGVELKLWPREIVGMIGENGSGSGKTTLIKILVGSLDRDEGAVLRRGEIGCCPPELGREWVIR